MRHITLTVILLCYGLLWQTPDAKAGSATEALRALLEHAMALQTQGDLQGEGQRSKRAQLTHQLIADNFLATAMAQASLQASWETLSQTQRQEFTALFIDLFQDSYTRLVLNYLHQETVEYRAEQPESDGIRLPTLLKRVNEYIPVDYAMVQHDGRWMVRDVTIDGVSIVGNYQQQFRRVIQVQSFDELLKKLRLQSQAIRGKPA